MKGKRQTNTSLCSDPRNLQRDHCVLHPLSTVLSSPGCQLLELGGGFLEEFEEVVADAAGGG